MGTDMRDGHRDMAQTFVSTRRVLVVALFILCIALSNSWFYGPWQIRLMMEALIGLLLIAWLLQRLRRGQGLPRTPIDSVALAVLLALGLSVLLAIDRRLAFGSIFFLVCYPLGFLFLVDLARDESWREALVSGALMVGGLFALVSFLEMADWYIGLGLIWPYDGWLGLGQGILPPTRLRAGVLWFVWPTTLAAYLGFLLPLAGARALAASRWPERSFWTAFTCLLGLALLFTFTRGGWLGAAVALAVMAAIVGSKRIGLWGLASRLRRRPVHLAMGAATCLLALLVLACFVGPGLEGRELASDLFRLELARMSWAAFAEHPVFGSGPDTFALATLPHLELQYLGRVVDHPHNMYLTLLVEEGAVGLLAAVALGLVILRTAWRALADPRGGRSYYLVLGALAGLLALAVHSLFNSFLHMPGVWLFGLISAVLVVTSISGDAGRRGRWSAVVALATLLMSLGVVANFELAQVHQQQAAVAGADLTVVTGELEKAVALDRTFGFYRQQLGHAYGLLAEREPGGDWAQRAVAELNSGLAAEPHYYLNQMRLAAVLRDTGDDQGALAAVERAVATNPKDYRPFLGLGVLLEDVGQTEEAVRAYARALAEEPAIYGAPFWQETTLRREQWAAIYDEAFQQTAELPVWRQAANRGALALAAGDYDRAIAEYGAEYPLGLGDAYLERGELEQALALYEEAARDAAVRWHAYEGIGQVQLAAGRLDEAERALRTALFVSLDQPTGNPREGDIYFDLGQVYERRGEPALALEAYEKAMPGPLLYLAYGTNLWHRYSLPLPEPAWLRSLDIVWSTPTYRERFAVLQAAYRSAGDENSLRRVTGIMDQLIGDL